MNPSSSSRVWDNPPPPGTEFSDGEDLSNSSSKKDGYSAGGNRNRIIDIDPYVKNPEYIEYERKLSTERPRYRSRSKSHGLYRRKRSRSRSTSRSGHRHRKSRSKSRRRRRRHSSSRSRSGGSRDHRDRHRHSRDRRRKRHSRSRSRSKSRSRTHKSHRSSKSERSKRSRGLNSPTENRDLMETINETNIKVEEEEEDEDEDDEESEPVKENAFKNDGSFLEMFKKMQEQQKVEEVTPEAEAKKPLPIFGKRRGGKVLKTGLVQKTKISGEDDGASAQDAWSVYMQEVRRYKEACCDDDSKTRPLVK